MKKIIFVMASFVFLMAGIARADSLKLLHTPATDVGVSIVDPGGSGGTFAGLYTLEFGPNPSSYQTYRGFCVDYSSIGWETDYNTFSMINVPDSLPYKQAAYIFENYGNVNGAAAQLAVWEVVFEGLSGSGANSVQNNAGVFYVKNDGGIDLTMVDSWVQDAQLNSAIFDTSAYRLLVSPSTTNYYGQSVQDFMVRVPEPGTLLLLGFGLVGLAGVRRKFRR